MNWSKCSVLVMCGVMLAFISKAQTFAGKELNLGEWRLHAPFKAAKQVAKVGNKIYCAANTGLYYLDTDDNTITVLGTEQGFASNQISLLKYSKDAQTLVIIHTNFNVDLLRNGKIYNISDIKTKSIIGLKTINDVFINGTDAYLACGFGIVKINLTKQEIADTYYLVPQGQSKPVNGVTIFNNYLYASTDKGLYRCVLNNPSIADYRAWQLDSMNNNKKLYTKPYKQLTVCNNQLVVNNYSTTYWQDTLLVRTTNGNWIKPATIVNYDVSDLTTINNELVVTFTGVTFVYDPITFNSRRFGIYTPPVSYTHLQTISDDNNGYYIADQTKGIIHCNSNFEQVTTYAPSSSFFDTGFRMNFIDSTLYVAGGGYDLSGFPNYRLYGVQSYKNFEWTYNFTGSKDIVPTAYFGCTTSSNVNPKNKAQTYFTSWSAGLLEINDSAGSKVGKLYNAKNTILQDQPLNPGFLAINNTMYDKNGNLWMDNAYASKPIVVKTQDNKWYSYGVGIQNRTKQLLIARNGYKWLAFPVGQGIAVYNDNGTLDDATDDEYRVLTNNEVNGALHTLNISCMTEDANGDIWIGTDKGITVFYNADNALKKNGTNYETFNAQQIKINVTGNVEYLLETEFINSIVVDAANRKWITTANSGVYLVNENGTEQLKHFTTENSPLIVNEIKCAAINPMNGEVFFGHDFGIQSYKAEATLASNNCNEVYAYPNPVRPEYAGAIAIKNVFAKSIVKITDMAGNFVVELNSLGGQALWDGKNSKGERVPTGIYIALVSNEATGKTCKTKIMLID
jgi:Two component regulator propeller